jgi:hypothetical protein
MSENVSTPCSPAAVRMRRSRERKRRGARVAGLELYAEDLAVLGQLGWIPSTDCDAATLGAAFCAFVDQALAVGIQPPQRPA